MLSRRIFLGVSASFVALPAFAKEPNVYTSGGLAVSGYDPVAYFTQEDAVIGSADHQSSYDGATFQFASADNKALFDADPAKYAPQYGGYCAYAVSKGYTASGDPHAWTVHDGKLYINFSKSVRALWTTRRAHHITSANENWPTVLGQ